MKFEESFNDFIGHRSINIANHISARNVEYKRISLAISELEINLRELDCYKPCTVLDEYIEAVLKREALLQELIYRHGLKDGAVLLKILNDWRDKNV